MKKNPFSIFDISHEITEITSEIVYAEMNGDTELVNSLFDKLEMMHAFRSEKHEAYIHVIKNAENAVTGHRAQADEHRQRASALENLSARLKRNLVLDLKLHKEDSTTAGEFKLARRKMHSVIIHGEVEDLPEQFQRVKIEPEKMELKRALKRGEEVDGVELTETEHLRISLK